MERSISRTFFFLSLGIMLFLLILGFDASSQKLMRSSNMVKPHLSEPHSLRITENKGQWNSNVRYKAVQSFSRIYFENQKFKYLFYRPEQISAMHPADPAKLPFKHLDAHVFSMNFLGSNPSCAIENTDSFEDVENFFLGNNPDSWARHVKSFKQLRYKEIYSGIDIKISSNLDKNGTALKYDYELAPGTNPNLIRIKYTGLTSYSINNGKLILKTSVNTLEERIPKAYQVIDGRDGTSTSVQAEGRFIPVRCEYRLSNDGVVSFYFPDGLDPNLRTVIDPELVFSTYTGAQSDNWGMTATYDSEGNLYSGGIINGENYPVSDGAFQASYNGGTPTEIKETNLVYTCDMALIKYNATGTKRLYATYLGGKNNEQPHSIIANSKGELFILGTTGSSNFPVTSGCYQPKMKGLPKDDRGGDIDMVVVRFNEDASDLIGSTYIGGSSYDGGNIIINDGSNPLYYFFADDGRGEIILDKDDNPYIAASTTSSNFPVTGDAVQANFAGKQDAVFFSLDNTLKTLRWSTYVGGPGYDAGYSLKLNDKGELYTVGGTNSDRGIPVTATSWNNKFKGGAADGFIIHFNNNHSKVLQGTYVGESGYEQTYFVDLDDEYNVYVLGQTTSSNYPAFGTKYNVPKGKQFVTKMQPDLTKPIFSFRFGSGSNSARPDITMTAFLVDICENIYISGWGSNKLTRFTSDGATSGSSMGLPVTKDAFQNKTTGSDFYIAVFSRDADSLQYATFIGGNRTANHVDGGTSRFDKNGIIYHSVCGSCSARSDGCTSCDDFPTTKDAFSRTNNAENCNNLSFKFKFDILNITEAKLEFDASLSENCIPLNVTFTNKSKGAKSYKWDFGDGATSEEENPKHIYTKPGIYKVTLDAINEDKCNKSDQTFTFITVEAPTDAEFKYSVDTCNKTVKFEDQSKDSKKYFWDFGDGKTTEEQSPTHQYDAPGIYTVTLITNPKTPCADKAIHTINIPDIPKPTYDYKQLPCQKEVHFMATSPDSIPIEWNFGNGNTSTERNPVFIFDSYGKKTVIIKSYPQLDCGVAVTIEIDIQEKPEAKFSYSPFNCIRRVEFTNLSEAESSLWDFGDASSVSKEQNPAHVYLLPGEYLVKLITNPNSSCADTAEALIKYIETPKPDFQIVSDKCKLETKFINLTDSTIKEHLWNFGDGKTSTERDPIHVYEKPGIYDVKYTSDPNTVNCLRSLVKPLEILPPSIPDFTYTPNCFLKVQFQESSQFAQTYSWDFGDSTTSEGPSPTHIYVNPGKYYVLLKTNEGTNCSGEIKKEVIVPKRGESSFKYTIEECTGKVIFENTSPEGNDFYWDFGDGNKSTEKNPTHVFDDFGPYSVILISNPNTPCPGVFRTTIKPSPKPVPVLEDVNFVCDTPIVFRHRSKGVKTVQWYVDGDLYSDQYEVVIKFKSPGKHIITLKCNSNEGCPAEISKDIWVQELPIADFVPKVDRCELTIPFQNLSIKSTHYFWDFGDGNTSTENSPTHTYKSSGSYLVKLVANPDSVCTSDKSERFYFGVNSGLDFEFKNDPCDSIIQFKVKKTGGPPILTYKWDFGDGSMSNTIEPAHKYAKHGTYKIKLITDKATSCESIIEKEITIEKKVKANFEFEQFTCDGNIILKNKSQNATKYLWNFGDGNISREINPVYQYKESNFYKVLLIAYNENNCTDTILIDLDYSKVGAAKLFIPNVFTPNNDGLNDFFEITGPYAQCVESIMIFDRWGVKVFESLQLSKYWDGKFGEEMVPEGAYIYVIRIKGQQRAGTVSVVR